MALTTIKTGGLADNSVTDAKVADAITVTGAQTGITQVGTLTAGTWQGTAIASAYLDADTAHLSGTQTFSGAKTFSSDIAISTSSDPALTLTSAEAGTDDWKIYIAGTGLKFRNTTDSNTAFELTEDNNATFAGQLKIDTDQRYFTKWESTYGNARDYWWRNDGGLLQLGEGAEGDAQVKYTFDTTNSRLGVGTTAPSQAITIKHSEPTILFIHDNAEIGFIGDCANFLTGSSPGSDSFGVRSAGDFRIGTGGNNLRMTIDSSGSTTFTGDVKANGSHSIQKVYRIPHPETSSTFTHTVNVESDLKGTRQGGIVQLIVKCYHTDYWYGLIYWTNDGGGTSNLNSVTEVALSSSGITVDATVGSGSNEIDIEFSGMHNNNHGYINNIIYDVYDL